MFKRENESPSTSADAIQWPAAAATRADQVVDRAADAAHRVIDQAASRVAPTVERVSAKVTAVQEFPADVLADLRQAVQDRPLMYLAVAFTAGMLFSALRR